MTKKSRASDAFIMMHYFRGTVLMFTVAGPICILLAPFAGGGSLVAGLFMLYGGAVFYPVIRGRPVNWLADRPPRLTRALLVSGAVIVGAGMLLLLGTIVGYFFATTLSYVLRPRSAQPTVGAPAQPETAEDGPSLADQWVDRSRALYPDEGELFWTHLSTQNFKRPSPFECRSRRHWEAEYRRYQDLALADTSLRNRGYVEHIYIERLEHYRRELRINGKPSHWTE